VRLPLVLLLAALPQAGPGPWRAGLATAKITPETPVVMAGYGGRLKPYQGVTLDVFAKALVLEDPRGSRVAIVTADLCDTPAALWDPVAAAIQKKTGLARERIVFGEAHNHSGPLVGPYPEELGGFAAEDIRNTIAWTKRLQERIVDLVALAAGRLEPARLSWGTGVSTFVLNRREATPKGVILGENPRGPADRSVPVLRVDAPEGTLRAALFGCACHNTTLGPNNTELSGDYAGFAQAFVQERHPGAQAMFLMGCGGDANPWPRGTMELAREHGATLGKEVCRILQSKLQPIAGSIQVASDQADLPFQELSRDEISELAKKGPGYKKDAARQMLAALDRGEKLPGSRAARFSVWQLGDLTMVQLSGEVVVDYVGLLEKSLGPLRLWIAAYCNDVYAYIPSARVLSEGGYETRGIFTGGAGFFAPGVEAALVGKVTELARKAGRP
jgi:neutral ceramidase